MIMIVVTMHTTVDLVTDYVYNVVNSNVHNSFEDSATMIIIYRH